MNKSVEKIKLDMMRRKKKRIQQAKREALPTMQAILPQDEERFSTYPTGLEMTVSEKTNFRGIHHILLKGLISLVLFGFIMIVVRTDFYQLESVRHWTDNVLREDFPFAKVHKWYTESFGNPVVNFSDKEDELQRTAMGLPMDGQIKETFQMNGTGIMIEANEQTEVHAWNDGIVVFAGKKRGTGNTVIVQHHDLSKSTYSALSSIDVHLYQAVKANQSVGSFVPNDEHTAVYFSISKDKQYIDPVQVIPVDDVR